MSDHTLYLSLVIGLLAQQTFLESVALNLSVIHLVTTQRKKNILVCV